MNAARNFWQSRSVVITGASSGIGWAIAERLAARGARLGLLARREGRLRQLYDLLRSQAEAISVAAADVTDGFATGEAITALQRDIGPCDVLIANAGIYRKTAARQFDPQPIAAMINTNYMGVVNAVSAVLPGMLDRKSGHLAVVSSIAAALGLPAAGGYCASKAALRILTQSLRAELHENGVKVSTFFPGHVDTPMITDEERESVKGLLSAEQAAARICKGVERGVAEAWFPRRTAWLAGLASRLPAGLYRRVMTRLPEMEET